MGICYEGTLSYPSSTSGSFMKLAHIRALERGSIELSL
jgi:hypothetical protein